MCTYLNLFPPYFSCPFCKFSISVFFFGVFFCFLYSFTKMKAYTVCARAQGPVARSLVSANRWLRGIKMYRFPWYLTLVSTNHASSNPGQASIFTILCPFSQRNCQIVEEV